MNNGAMAGALVEPLDTAAIDALLGWLFRQQARPGFVPDGQWWAVAQCTDTLAWGVLHGDTWHWSHQEDSSQRPPSSERIMELRVFSETGEYLIWQASTASGSFKGRWLTECEQAIDSDLKPIDLELSFLPEYPEKPLRDEEPLTKYVGERFTKWISPGGRVVVAPNGKTVLARRYLSEDPRTGVLRAVAHRLVCMKASEQ